MLDFIDRLQKMADLYYQEGRDIEAAIIYEALGKAYAEQGAKMAQLRIECIARASALRKYQAPAPIGQPRNHIFTITDGTVQ